MQAGPYKVAVALLHVVFHDKVDGQRPRVQLQQRQALDQQVSHRTERSLSRRSRTGPCQRVNNVFSGKKQP